MSRVTTITLPDEVYRGLVERRARTGRPIAGIIRDALARDMAPPAGKPRSGRSRARRLPPSVVDWLSAAPGSFASEVAGVSALPTDWDPDGTDPDLDAD